MTNALQPLADNANLPTIQDTLGNIYDILEKSAAQALSTAIEESGDTYSVVEQRAMLMAEMLNQSKGLDFAAVMTRGRLLETIETESLHTMHPAGYQTMEQLAVDQGISVSEVSQTLDMYKIIFPWIERNLGLSPALMWEQVGKSNMRELVPILKRIITGEEARASVETAYEHVMNNVYGTAQAAGQEIDEVEAQRRAVQELLDDGVQLTNANLRQRIRPDRTPSIEAYLLRQNGNTFLVAPVNDAQEELLARRMHGYWDLQPIHMDQRLRPIAHVRAAFRTLFEHLDLEEA